MQFRSRASFSGNFVNGTLTLKKFAKNHEISVNKDDITSVELCRSIYDIPFLEKTVIIRTPRKTYKIKRLPKKQAESLYKELANL